MKNLVIAIMAHVSGGATPTALWTAIGGRVYLDEAPEGTAYPYAVFTIVVSTPDDTFTEEMEETLVQFSLFSTSPSVSEIATLYGHLKTLLKNAVLTVTGGVNVWLEQRSLTTTTEDHTTIEGMVGVRHWAVDYSILVRQL